MRRIRTRQTRKDLRYTWAMADFKSTGDWKLDLFGNGAVFILFASMAAVVGVAIGEKDRLASGAGRAAILAGMVLFAVIYTLLRKWNWGKVTFAILQIAGALVSNWYSLGDASQKGIGAGSIDRLLFVCGGIALIAKGLKDLDEVFWERVKAAFALNPKGSSASSGRLPF
jgi:hypothetical protein